MINLYFPPFKPIELLRGSGLTLQKVHICNFESLKVIISVLDRGGDNVMIVVGSCHKVVLCMADKVVYLATVTEAKYVGRC